MRLPAWRDSLDVTANVAVIGTCVALCVLLVVPAIANRINKVTVRDTPEVFPVGTTLTSVDGFSFGAADFTVLIGLSTTCRYCEESLPALRRLEDVARSRGDDELRVLAMSIQPTELVQSYLRKNGLSMFQAVTIAGGSSFVPVVRQTPTVVLADREGSVRGSWVGLISIDRLEQILTLLK